MVLPSFRSHTPSHTVEDEPDRQGRDGPAVEAQMPEPPRAFVEDTDRRIPQHSPQRVRGHPVDQPPHVVQRAERHQLGDEQARIGQGEMGGLPPDVLARHGRGAAVRQTFLPHRFRCSRLRTNAGFSTHPQRGFLPDCGICVGHGSAPWKASAIIRPSPPRRAGQS